MACFLWRQLGRRTFSLAVTAAEHPWIGSVGGVVRQPHGGGTCQSRCASSTSTQSLASTDFDREYQLIVAALKHKDFFGVKDMVTLKDLFNARVHLGHKVGCRNPRTAQYLFGCRQDIDMFDLEKTLPHLHLALNFAGHIAYRGGVILFVSRNRQLLPLIERTAKESGEYSHCRYWVGGSFTDSASKYGLVTRLPDLCIFLNALNNVFIEHIGVTECAKMLIPVIGVVDSNCDPALVTYPIPGNDDSPSAMQLYCKLFKEVILKAKAKRKTDLFDTSADV